MEPGEKLTRVIVWMHNKKQGKKAPEIKFGMHCNVLSLYSFFLSESRSQSSKTSKPSYEFLRASPVLILF